MRASKACRGLRAWHKPKQTHGTEETRRVPAALTTRAKQEWWRNDKECHLNCPRVGWALRVRGRGRRVEKIINVETKRENKISGQTYKKTYKNIILRGVVKDLSNILTVDYKVKGNCVQSYVKEYFGEKLMKKYIPKEPTYCDILKMCKENKITFTAETITGHELENYKSKGRKKLNIIISQEHMYVKDKDIKEKKQTKIITKVNDIYNYHKSELIVLKEQLFNNIQKEIKKNHNLVDYNEDTINFKTNKIIFDENYTNLIEYKINHESTSRTLFKVMESVFQLQGYMNEETYKYFEETDQIINYKKYEEKEKKIHYVSDRNHWVRKTTYPIRVLLI